MIFSYLLNMQSHPSWVCGLKLLFILMGNNGMGSHPSWVCGLKLDQEISLIIFASHTLRGCVD